MILKPAKYNSAKAVYDEKNKKHKEKVERMNDMNSCLSVYNTQDEVQAF